MDEVQQRLDSSVIGKMRREIERSGGQETLFVGRVDQSGIVIEVEVYARGNEIAVAAPAEFCERGEIVIHNHPSGSLRPSEADISVAAHLSEFGIGSAIVDNAVEGIYVLVEPVVPEEITPLDGMQLAGDLEDGGAIARELPGFLERPSQVAMLRNIVEGFNEDRIVVAEAGTGVGKSFAYLIPAVAWAVRNRERIVIATATINLQQQLIDQDLQTVQRALGTSVKCALVKGRGNYLCRRRLEEEREEQGLFDASDELEAVRQWAEESPTGSRSDLPFMVKDDLWSRIHSEADTCSVARCPDRERCFILKARRAAAGAQILVANHHLVFSDLAVRQAGAGWEGTVVLPPFQRLIFDEAHNLERAATSFFSESVSYGGILRQLGRLLRRRGTRRFGLMERLPGLDAGVKELQAVETEIDRVREQAEQFNSRVALFVGEEPSWRLSVESAESFREGLAVEFTEMHQAVMLLAARMGALARSIDDRYREDPSFLLLVAITRRLEVAAAIFDRFREGAADQDGVYWLDLRRDARGRSSVTVVITPVDIRPTMEQAVFRPYATVVLTSATLSVQGSFQFWGERIGLPLGKERVILGEYPSPFDYSSRVMLAAPQDAPAPDDPRYQDYLELVIQHLVNASQGGALLLFTSYRQLKSVFDKIAPLLEQRGYPCYRQGEADRAHLLKMFREDMAGVLFATDSFWEGIDAPGETLRLVIVCRLPFRVPSDPVQKARAEAIERAGGNSFGDLSLPQAVMRLKQGFGRLMRRSDDYGAVVITDSRIIHKPYGRVFWESLPPAKPLVVPGELLVEEIQEWISRFRSRD